MSSRSTVANGFIVTPANGFHQAHTVSTVAACVVDLLQPTAKQGQQQVRTLLALWFRYAGILLPNLLTSPCCAASVPDTASLGKTGLTVSALGIGTLQWGDTQCGYGSQYDEVKIYAQTPSPDVCPPILAEATQEASFFSSS